MTETKRRTLRAGAVWDDAARVASEHDQELAVLIRAFLAWYAGWPGATLPPRPVAEDEDD